LIPHIVWQNLHPLLEEKEDQFIKLVENADPKSSPNLASIMPRVIDRLLGSKKFNAAAVVSLVVALCDGKNARPASAAPCLAMITDKIQTGEIAGDRLKALAEGLKPTLAKLMAAEPKGPLHGDASVLAASLNDPQGCKEASRILNYNRDSDSLRIRALKALLSAGDENAKDVMYSVEIILLNNGGANGSLAFRGQVIDALGRSEIPEIASVVLICYRRLEPELQSKAIELLTQRVPWSKQLLKEIANKKIPPGALNVNHVRKLLASKDADIIKQVKEQWGTLREERNPEREKVVADMKKLLAGKKGDPMAGQVVFKNVCAQCHKIYGEGQDVGPDITSNGRASYDQLLSNVFDPSLVIGAAYQATTVTTTKGRVLTGILVEDNNQRVVLKEQGGKLETIPRSEIEEMNVSKVSLMPEGIEKQLKEQEIIDLFAFLTLDKPPSDPTAKPIPGTPK
jgi:putative heme-binding domain-containing protein